MCEHGVSDVKKVRNFSKQLNDETDMLVIDTGGITNYTIAKLTFYITDIVEGKQVALFG